MSDESDESDEWQLGLTRTPTVYPPLNNCNHLQGRMIIALDMVQSPLRFTSLFHQQPTFGDVSTLLLQDPQVMKALKMRQAHEGWFWDMLKLFHRRILPQSGSVFVGHVVIGSKL